VDIKDVVIIGAGPAGIATAIQLKRYNIEFILLEQEETGGLLRNAYLVENYPGFPEGIKGLELVKLFKKQLKKSGIEVSSERVLELEYRDSGFLTKTSKTTIMSKIAVIASGTKPKRISSLPVSDDIKDRIFYEVYPIRKLKKKKFAIIGAGDAAFDYALSLSQNNEVIILNRKEQAMCVRVLEQRCIKSKVISYSSNVSVAQINKKGKKLLLTLIHSDNQKESQISVDYVVIAVGREPCDDFLGGQLKKNFRNLLKARNLYMVGDIKNRTYRQTAICAGDGIKAGMQIYKKLKREEK
jgi:thioredoxin reductase (NADPH)